MGTAWFVAFGVMDALVIIIIAGIVIVCAYCYKKQEEELEVAVKKTKSRQKRKDQRVLIRSMSKVLESQKELIRSNSNVSLGLSRSASTYSGVEVQSNQMFRSGTKPAFESTGQQKTLGRKTSRSKLRIEKKLNESSSDSSSSSSIEEKKSLKKTQSKPKIHYIDEYITAQHLPFCYGFSSSNDIPPLSVVPKLGPYDLAYLASPVYASPLAGEKTKESIEKKPLGSTRTKAVSHPSLGAFKTTTESKKSLDSVSVASSSSEESVKKSKSKKSTKKTHHHKKKRVSSSSSQSSSSDSQSNPNSSSSSSSSSSDKESKSKSSRKKRNDTSSSSSGADHVVAETSSGSGSESSD